MSMEFLIASLVLLVTVAAHLAIARLVLNLPLLRRERARLFLDVIDAGIQQGQSPAQAVISLSKRAERGLGMRLHLVAAYLDCGASFPDALAQSRGLLPPKIIEVLRVGVELGDIRRVLPAARKMCEGAGPQVRLTLQIIVFVLLLYPVAGVMGFLGVKILPQFELIFRDMLGTASLPPITMFIFRAGRWLTSVYLLLSLFVWGFVLLHSLGPRIRLVVPALPLDLLEMWLPWRRKRLKRDFTMMLAILLDAGMPELEAVASAARSTANGVFIRRATRVQDALRAGVPITEAISVMDNDGELRWRVDNARHGGDGFLRALSAWHETLEAKAFQQEQTLAHIIRTLLILLNGTVIGFVAVGLFAPLIEIISRLTPW